MTTAPGPLSADVSWSGQATLRLRLSCGTASAEQLGANGLFVSLDSPGGSCQLTLSEAVATDEVVSYPIFVQLMTATPGASS